MSVELQEGDRVKIVARPYEEDPQAYAAAGYAKDMQLDVGKTGEIFAVFGMNGYTVYDVRVDEPEESEGYLGWLWTAEQLEKVETE